jgi:subfamily B ATP-binding cassette protein HlyB/CyaB
MDATSAAHDPSKEPSKAGVTAFVFLLQFHGLAVDAKQLRHQYGNDFGFPEMLRAAKALGLKARTIRSDFSRLGRTPLPAIAADKSGGYFIMGKMVQDKVLIQHPSARAPELITREAFEALWNGQLFLAARRAGLGELARRFDITWFLQAVKKYKRLLAEVLVASFFLQLFALVSPLFFQVVIDKVLVHRGVTTLDVLILGLVIISLFESVLTALRTYVFAHTTSRIDVELGARLFRHLAALPIADFEARRTGDTAQVSLRDPLPMRFGSHPCQVLGLQQRWRVDTAIFQCCTARLHIIDPSADVGNRPSFCCCTGRNRRAYIEERGSKERGQPIRNMSSLGRINA